jgi:hypothetical protein
VSILQKCSAKLYIVGITTSNVVMSNFLSCLDVSGSSRRKVKIRVEAVKGIGKARMVDSGANVIEVGIPDSSFAELLQYLEAVVVEDLHDFSLVARIIATSASTVQGHELSLLVFG